MKENKSDNESIETEVNQEIALEAEEELSELNTPIWAVLDGITVYATDLTYAQALESQIKYPAATITTSDAASRLQV